MPPRSGARPRRRRRAAADAEPLILGLKNRVIVAFDSGKAALAEQAALDAEALAEQRLE